MRMYSRLLAVLLPLLSSCAGIPRVPLPSVPLPDIGRAVNAAGRAGEAVLDSVTPIPALPSNLFPPLFETREVLGINLDENSAQLLENLGFDLTETRDFSHLGLRLWRIRIPAGGLVSVALTLLRSTDRQAAYSANVIYRLSGTDSHCTGTRCYGQQMVGLGAGRCKVNMRLGVIDSRVEPGHVALMGQRIQLRRHDVAGRPSPRIDHGTAVATLLVGAPGSDFPGMLPSAELLAADVFNLDDEQKPYTDVTAIVDALDWMVGQGTRIINMSFSGPPSELLHQAIQAAAGKGVLLIAAAGNLGPDAAPQYPAAYPEVLAVTAIDRRLSRYRAAVTGEQIALAAPGVGIWTTDLRGAGQFRDGTSFAVPFATAAAARIWAKNPSASADAVTWQLTHEAKDLGPPGQDHEFGWGLVNTPACDDDA